MTEPTETIETPAVDGAVAPAHAEMPQAKTRDIGGWLVLLLGLGAPLVFVIAAAGTGFGLWPWQTGLGIVPWTAVAALVALLFAAGRIIWARAKGRAMRWPRLMLGSAAALAFLVYMGGYAMEIANKPAIHDITTDLADPPAFASLPLRADNMDNIPGADDSEMQGMNPRQRWALLHQRAYPDIRSVRVGGKVADVIAKAERLAADRGWEIASSDPVRGRLEATVTVSLFRFKDDVVLRVRATDNGAASVIDMRSVSRVGVHDLGVNAKRVRAFLSDLSGTTTTAS
jgi:hypothetical protein